MRRLDLPIVAIALLIFAALQVDARLPKPNVTEAVILALDTDTQSLVVKTGKYEKPVVLDWDKETAFLRRDHQIGAASLKRGETVEIHYKRISFKNPLLKEAVVVSPALGRSESRRSNE